jgi:cytochrome c-type biogenesis protein
MAPAARSRHTPHRLAWHKVLVMTDVSLALAFVAGLVSFLSPCVLPLVPGYISMLSGIGVEQLRKGDVPSSRLFASSIAFVAGFSAVFISFGASASAIGGFLKEHRTALTPIAGALILLFGLHLLGVLIKLTYRAGIMIGALLVGLGIVSLFRHAPLFFGLGALHFFSLSIIGFFGPALARWLNRDVHLRNTAAQPGPWSGFLLGFAFAFGWTPCIGPILTTVLALAAASGTVARGVLLLAIYSAGLAVPFLLTTLLLSRFLRFYQGFRKYLHAVEIFSGALLLFVGGLVFVNKLTWLTGKLSFLDNVVRWLEHALTTGTGGPLFLSVLAVAAVVLLGRTIFRNSKALASAPVRKVALVVIGVVVVIVGTFFADKATRVSGKNRASVTLGDEAIDQPAPDVTLKDLDGKTVSLAQYRGKVVLVNFWATWCAPCREEIPWLIEMQKTYGDKGFTVLGVAMDEEGKSVVAPYAQTEKFDVNGTPSLMSYPILLGNDATADKFGGLLGYPTSVLISRDGKQIKRVTGIIDKDEISKFIESQL